MPEESLKLENDAFIWLLENVRKDNETEEECWKGEAEAPGDRRSEARPAKECGKAEGSLPVDVGEAAERDQDEAPSAGGSANAEDSSA